MYENGKGLLSFFINSEILINNRLLITFMVAFDTISKQFSTEIYDLLYLGIIMFIIYRQHFFKEICTWSYWVIIKKCSTSHSQTTATHMKIVMFQQKIAYSLQYFCPGGVWGWTILVCCNELHYVSVSIFIIKYIS